MVVSHSDDISLNNHVGLSQTENIPQTQNPLIDIPVLIVGGGPSGLMLSYLLSKLDVRTLVIERYAERLAAPKAHALSPRSLEICRQFGLDVNKIRSLGTKREAASQVNFLTTLSGDLVGALPYERMDTDVLDFTPEMLHNVPQPAFEQLLADQLHQAENADIRKGVSFVSLVQNIDSVITTVEERATNTKYQIRSQIVVGCDGARSKVREHLGIECDGEDSYETMMTIHFNADLRPIVGKRVGMLHWLFDPMASGFIIAYDLGGNAVLISNFDSTKHPVNTWSEELCRNVLRDAIGEEIEPRILSYRPWLLSRRIAKSYGRGNVFLAGDAAHSFPPTGGLGLNSGLGDVHNLAFKIAACLQGQASSTCLDSYQAERRHVAEVNSQQSVNNGKKIFNLLKTLGTAGFSDLQQARKRLFETIRDPCNEQKIKSAIEEQREHFDNLNLHIGYVYGDITIPENASIYTPKFVVGARLPHTWIRMENSRVPHRLPPVDLSYVTEMSSSEASQKRYSILDLCAFNAFTLILPTSKVFANNLDEFCQVCSKKDVKVNTYRYMDDFTLEITNSKSTWIQDAGLVSGTGFLVRPDQHILCTLSATTSSTELLQALSMFFGKDYRSP